jgi:hypothetical protein
MTPWRGTFVESVLLRRVPGIGILLFNKTSMYSNLNLSLKEPGILLNTPER